MVNTPFLQPVLSKAPRYREATYTAIKEAILAGQLGPNQPLVEEQIAASLNVSRTPVREALAILEHEGLIGPRNGRGLYVCAMTRAEFVAIFAANETVEPHLVRRAAIQATPAQLEELSVTIARARESATAHDSTGFLGASRDFHRLVGIASGNMPLAEFVVRNEERTDMFLIGSGKVINLANMEASNREHAAILGALIDRDPDAAARLAVYHAQSLRERFAEHFNAEGSAGNATAER